jgi:hypothetical protein
MERAMRTRRSFDRQTTIRGPISKSTVSVHDRAVTMAPDRDRDEARRKLRQAETAMHLQEWANSPGLQPPK